MAAKNIVEIDSDLKEIMAPFLVNREKDMTSITEFLASNKIKEIEVLAHKIAGNAGGYGLPDLGKMGKAMEYAAQKSDIENIKKLHQQMKQYLKDLEIKFV